MGTSNFIIDSSGNVISNGVYTGLINGYLPISGGTLTGRLTLAENGVNPLDAVALQQINYISGATILTSSTTLVSNTTYLSNGSTLLSLLLPLTANVGDFISITGMGVGLFTITQNAGQIIYYGSANTTSGTDGSLSSTFQCDSLELICSVANTEFIVKNSIGNLTVI